MRRSLLLAGTTALALGLAACGGGGDKPADPTDAPTTAEETTGEEQTTEEETTAGETTAPSGDALVVWVDETRQAGVKAAADKFTADTGMNVEIVLKNFGDIKADFIAQVPTGEGPDITVGAHDWIGELTKNGVVSPIELGDKVGDFNEKSIQVFTQDGQIYAVPYAIETVGLLRNVDLAPDPVPATFDEMIAKGKEIGKDYPFLIQVSENGDPFHMYAFQTSFGAPVFKTGADGGYVAELGLAGEPGHNFANWLKEQGAAGTLDTAITFDIAKEQFAAGNAPYMLGGPWLLQDFKDLNLAVDTIPSAGGQPAAPFMGVQGFYLSAESKNTIVATDFLTNYIATDEVQMILFQSGDRTPALKSAAEKAAATSPVAKGFADLAEVGAPMPSIPEMGKVWNYWGVTEAQILGGADPVATWDKMVADIEGAIK